MISLVCIYAFALFSVADVVLVLVVSVVYGAHGDTPAHCTGVR